MFKVKTALKSGDLVEIKNKETSEVVYKGFILGMNEKVVITAEFNTTPKNLESNVVLSMDDSLIKSDFFKTVLHDKTMGTPFDLDQGVNYREFSLKTHEVVTIDENVSDVKAYLCNDIYDFMRNKWVSNHKTNSHKTVFSTDNPISGMNNVIVLSVGSENLYCIRNGIQFSLKFPFIENWKQLEIGLYNFTTSENSALLEAHIIQSYEEKLRNEWISSLEKKVA